MRQMLCALAVVLVAIVGIGAAKAAPRKSAASDNNILGMIRRGFDGVQKKPALFDGRVVPATANIREARELLAKLKHGIEVYELNWQNLSDEAKASAELKAAQATYNDLKPYYVAFGPALQLREKQNAQAEADARAKQEAERKAQADADERKRAADAAADAAARAKQEAERKAQQDAYESKRAADATQEKRRDTVCGGFWSKLPDRATAQSVADATASVPESVKEVTEKKQLLEKGAAVCKALEYTDVAALRELCKDRGQYTMGNTYPADVCEATAHLDDTMRAGIGARVGREVAWNPAPSIEDLRFRDGYIQTLEPFLVDMDLKLSDANKKALVEKWGPLYAAAGIPFDESAFEPIKAYYDKYRATVETLATEWTTPGQKCKGGIIAKVCNMAKKDVLTWHKKAKIIKVTTDDVVYVKGSEAELDGWVLYQLPGEKYCQFRAWTVNEDGGNRHHLATRLNYVRIQQCK